MNPTAARTRQKTPTARRSGYQTQLEPVDCSRDQRRVIEMACSLLLDYPDKQLERNLDAVRAELAGLPEVIAAPLSSFCNIAQDKGLRWLQEHYVETFDQRRRCALYLSYYSQGDTRGRGQAILAFREVMDQAGFHVMREELPDYLPVVLEFAALDPTDTAEQLLSAHREGIEVIRAALDSANSVYVYPLQAIIMMLPPADERALQAFHRLVRQGPPSEMVGIHPVAPRGGAMAPGTCPLIPPQSLLPTER